MQGLPKQKIEVPFAKGLDQKTDDRLKQGLVRAIDVEFDDLGGLRLRYPFASIGANVFSGGTISGCRRVYACGDELLLFTSDKLYSWSSQRSAWVSRGTHLAVKVDEAPRFVTTGDQVQCDRAELSNVIVYTWVDLAAGSSISGTVYYAIVDKTTGAALVAPTAVTGATGRPRVVATTTKILLMYIGAGPQLFVRSIDPTTCVLSAATTVMAANFDSAYDVVKTEGADSVTFAARRNPTTSYEVGKITAALAVTQSTKARTCTGAIAVAVNPGDDRVQVIRGNAANVQGDLLTSALADFATATAIGTATAGPIGFITCAFKNDDVCCVYWSDETATSFRNVKHNTVEADGVSIGSEAVFVRQVELASRAFGYNGNAYVHLQFCGTSSFISASSLFDGVRAQLQNSYFLYRDDGFLCAKQVYTRAGGAVDVTGWLPGVALTSGSTGFSWCGTERRVVPIGTLANALGYSDRGPRDITITFDSNEARRVAKLGETLYIAAGEILQYDGNQITECGFHVYPYRFGIAENAAGSIAANGGYGYRGSYRWDNARGERERSTTATSGSAPIAAQPGSFDITDVRPLFITHKASRPIAMEVWRTAVDPNDDSPFYLVTSQDPTDTTGANCYIANDTTLAEFASFNDDMVDSTLTAKESNPENYGVLENLSPPAATLIVANDLRLFLAGVAGDPHRIWYSKQRNAGEIAAFHDALTVAIPEAGGAITGLAFLNESLVVFRETAIYALSGLGYDNTGGGQNYEARLISSTEGAVSHEAICLTPMGLLFKSSKGWFLLNRGWSPEYIGAPVCDYDSDTIHAVHVIENRHQVRIVTSARVLMLDYVANAWSEWSITDGLHACVWNGTHHVLATAAVRSESSSYATADYGWDVEMLFHLDGMQGFARLYRILLLGEVRGSGSIRWRVGGYTADTYWDDRTWTISPTTVGGVLECQHGPSRPQQKAVRIRLTSHTSVGEKPKLSALTLDVGLRPGVFRHLPAAQRQ